MPIATECFASAFVSTILISLVPNFLLFFFPSCHEVHGNIYLSLGQALAAGGLLGDVFLHSLPHMYESDAYTGSDDKLMLGLMILAGFMTFYVMDTMVRLISAKDESSHQHCNEQLKNVHEESSNSCNGINGMTKRAAFEKRLTSTVILNIVADSLHNFTDGLAIGATYGAHECRLRQHVLHDTGFSFKRFLLEMIQSRGGLASMSVLVHEIPHEMGDFAILVKNGFTKNEAIGIQFFTAIAALTGTAVGLASVEIEHIGRWMVPFTSGGFIYMAASNILPELMAEAPTINNSSAPSAFFVVRFLQILALTCGIGVMFQVAKMEHGGHSHVCQHDGVCNHAHERRVYMHVENQGHQFDEHRRHEGHDHFHYMYGGNDHLHDVHDGHDHLHDMHDGHEHLHDAHDGHEHLHDVHDGHEHLHDVHDGHEHLHDVHDGHEHLHDEH